MSLQDDSGSFIASISGAVEELRGDDAQSLVKEALAQGLSPLAVLNDGILLGMKKFGDRFGKGEYFLPELLLGADIAKRCIQLVTPHLPAGQKSQGKVVIGAVKGDVHTIGKDLVAMQLSLAGFEVHNMGIDVPTMKFIEKAQEVGADIIGLSAFLSSTIPYMAEMVKYLKDMGLRKTFFVIIGGTGTGKEYARGIGADGWAKDCFDAVPLCRQLMALKEDVA